MRLNARMTDLRIKRKVEILRSKRVVGLTITGRAPDPVHIEFRVRGFKKDFLWSGSGWNTEPTNLYFFFTSNQTYLQCRGSDFSCHFECGILWGPDPITHFFGSGINFEISWNQCCGSGSGSSRIRILLALLDPDPDPYIIYGSGSSSLKTDDKFKHLDYFITFLKSCLKSIQILSSVLKKFLHNQTKYDINWKIKNFIKLFLCHEIAWIRIHILQKGLDPDPYIKYTDPQHCLKYL